MSATALPATPPAMNPATPPAMGSALNPSSSPAQAIKPLSERQASCLHWAALGKTSWETARILGVSESTVNFHLCNACEKLGVRGRRAAVVAALRLGLIEPVTA
nr:helix-turn-helix domain-containing protein [Achromobacter xylosoxidans]